MKKLQSYLQNYLQSSLPNWLPNGLKPLLTIRRLQQQVDALTGEIEKLQRENDSMRTGMRRCISCDYRLDYKQRQRGAHLTATKQDDRQP